MTRSLFISSLVATVALGQTPTRVGDLLSMGNGARSSETLRGATLGSTLVFGVKTPASGFEVWASDGTASGTRPVTDLAPGPTNALGGNFFALSGKVYFTGSSGVSDGIWRTDGTSVELVANRYCETFRAVGAQLWCISTGAIGRGLYVIDSAGVGAEVPISIFGLPWYGDSLNGALYYESSDGELWKTDGTAGGATRVKDLRPSSSTHSIHSPIVRMGTRVYFAADDGVSGLELWSSDGTTAGTTLVSDIVAGSGGALVEGITIPVKLWATSTRVFFFARTAVGIELWSTDGTSAGTRLTADLTMNGDTFSATSDIVVFQDQVFFSGGDGELWKSDGTTAGTVQVKDVLPGTSRASPHDFFTSAGLLFFSARSATGFDELWRSDGTAAGTFLLKPRSQLAPQVYSALGTLGTQTVFLGYDATAGAEPWISDGTVAGTRVLADLTPGPDYAFSSPRAFARLGASLLFFGRTTQGPLNLYRSNGTQMGTQVLKTGFLDVRSIVSNGSRAWFVSGRNQLWTTDGTTAGTLMLKQYQAATFDDSARELTLVGTNVFFVANDATTGWEPWFSDGTVAGTRVVKDLVAGTMGSGANALVQVNGTGYFLNNGSTGTQLMKTDFTATGTTVVKDFGTDFVSGLTVAGTKLFGFVSQKNKLMVSDGTTAATVFLDVGTSATLEVLRLDALGGSIVLRALEKNGSGASDDVAELWGSDGTAGNTRRLTVLGAPWQSTLANFGWHYAPSAVTGNKLVFPFASSTTVKLWVTDGTPAGTSLLRDLAGPSRSDVAWASQLGVAGGLVYFAGTDGATGTELWKTDGTSAGTVLVSDLVPGPGSSSPAGFFLVEPNLYFSAFDAAGDEELWKLDLGLDNTPPVITPMVSGTMGQNGWYTSVVRVTFQVTDPESAVSAMNGCAPTTLTSDTMSFTFTCTATSRGGTSTSSVTVKRDATPPMFTCPGPQTVEATASSGALVTFTTPTAMDEYSGMTPVRASSLSGGTFPLGDSDIIFTSSDAAGNEGRCTSRVTVRDTTAPSISCPPDATLKATTLGTPSLTVRATSMDSVDPMPSVTQSIADGAALALGVNRITATATDVSGNKASCEFVVTVEPADAVNPQPKPPVGCGCNGGGAASVLAALAIAVVRRRRNAR